MKIELTKEGLEDRIHEAIDMAISHGGHDGEHHKAWCIDQMVRILAGERYTKIVNDCIKGGWSWDVGIAP